MSPFPSLFPFPPRNQSDPCPQKPWSAGDAWTGGWDSVVSGEQLCGARRGLLPVKEPGKWRPDPRPGLRRWPAAPLSERPHHPL